MSKKKLATNMIASFVAFAVSAGINVILSPYLIKTVGVEAFGFVSLGQNFIDYASLLTIALNSMAGRFIAIEIYKKDWEKAKIYFTSVIIANVFMAILLLLPSISIVLFLDKFIHVPQNIMFEVKLLFGFLFFNFIFSLITNSYGVVFFATNTLYLNSKRQIESSILKAVVLTIAFSFFSSSVWYIGLAYSFTTLYIAFANIHYFKKLLPDIVIKRKYFDLKAVVEITLSGLWNVFTRLGSIMATGLDLLIANLFINATAMGTLSVAKLLPTLIISLFSTLSVNFAPNLTKSFAEGDFSEMKKQIITSIKILGVFASLPMAILFALGDEFYRLWVPTQDPILLQWLTLATCMAYVISLALEPLWNVFGTINKLKAPSLYLFFNSIATIIIVFICMNLFKAENVKLFIIAGVSTILSIIRALFFMPMKAAHLLKFKLWTFYPVMIKNFIALCLTTVFAFLVNYFVKIDSWISLILMSLLICILGIMIGFIIIFSKEERKIFSLTIVQKMNLKSK
jgi:O-antigen/teichoic acid export membrane protein